LSQAPQAEVVQYVKPAGVEYAKKPSLAATQISFALGVSSDDRQRKTRVVRFAQRGVNTICQPIQAVVH
jgi:hypothetical protein